MINQIRLTIIIICISNHVNNLSSPFDLHVIPIVSGMYYTLIRFLHYSSTHPPVTFGYPQRSLSKRWLLFCCFSYKKETTQDYYMNSRKIYKYMQMFKRSNLRNISFRGGVQPLPNSHSPRRRSLSLGLAYMLGRPPAPFTFWIIWFTYSVDMPPILTSARRTKTNKIPIRHVIITTINPSHSLDADW